MRDVFVYNEDDENLEIRALFFLASILVEKNDKTISETFHDIEKMAEECKKVDWNFVRGVEKNTG